MWVVVPQQALPPDAPCLSIGEFGDWAVKKSNRGTTVVVLRDPVDCLVDTVFLSVHEATADFIAGCADFVVHHLHSIPDVVHVEFVRHSLQWGPQGAETVIVLADVVHDLVEGLHRDRSEVVSELIVRCVGDNFHTRVAIHVHCWHVVLLSSSRVELLQSLHRHRVNGVRNRLVEVAGETLLHKEPDADVGFRWHGIGQPNGEHKTDKDCLQRHFSGCKCVCNRYYPGLPYIIIISDRIS